MDPASQLGWRNQRAAVEGPEEELVRDILEATDAIHTDSMSDMAGSTENTNESPVSADESLAGSVLQRRDGSLSPDASGEVDRQGGCGWHLSQCVFRMCLGGSSIVSGALCGPDLCWHH